jgi:hypothetical protein
MTELTLKTTLHELDASTLEKLKSLFAGEAVVQITISNIPDETAHLLSTQSNRESLERSLEQFKAGDFVQKTEEEFVRLLNHSPSFSFRFFPARWVSGKGGRQ